MDELVKIVSQKTGLPEAQAKVAVEAVLNYLKTKVPEPFGAQIDAILQGGDMPDLGGLAGGLGGLLG